MQAHPLLRQWFAVGPGRQLTLATGKVELGQGIGTALVQIACDALGVEPEQVVMVAGDTARTPDEGYTAGSLSIQQGGAALRWACEHAAALFAARAAARWKVPAREVQVRAGVFRHPRIDALLDYWSLAHEVDLAHSMLEPAPVTLRPDMRHAGRSLPRLDLPARLAGAGFIHDLVLPGMLHARVLRGTHPSQRLLDVPLADLRALAGVTHVVHSGNFLALLGPREGPLVRAAAKAETLLRRTASPLQVVPDVAQFLTSAPVASERVHRAGEPAAGVHQHEAIYSRPYLAHASIGPACGLADPRGGHLRVWSHSQGVFPLRAQIARALGRAVSTVEVTHAPGAGCYGHNGADDAAFDAALIATLTGLPVRVQWMRHDEFSASPFGSAGAVRLAGEVDAQGRISRWDMAIWSHTHMARPGWGDGVQLLGAWEMDPPQPVPPALDLPLPVGGGHRNAIALYDLPHQQVDYHFVAGSPVRVSALRSLGSYGNLYAIECFMDELAGVAGSDPLAFRLRHLGAHRARAVLEQVAAMAKWTDRGDEGTGDGLGLAVGRYKNQAAWCAVAARISVDAQVRVREVWVAVDAGAVVNPDGLANQIEGGVMQSLSWTLHESVQWDETGITSIDWEHYPIASFADAPAIHVQIIARPDEPSLGVGEAAAGPTAAAIANAVAHALGIRARHLPLTAPRLADAIHSS
jgi:CO/xanthine dehydrogenase Mo-binding subunit